MASEEPMDEGRVDRGQISEAPSEVIAQDRAQLKGKQGRAPIDRRRLTDAQQEYFDAGELLDWEHASLLSGWTERELLIQPIARVHVAGGHTLFSRASLRAVMALRATSNEVETPIGPEGQECAACMERRGPIGLTVGIGTSLCDRCPQSVVRTDSESTLENTELSRGPAAHDAPGSTTAGDPGPHPHPGNQPPLDGSNPGIAT